MEDKEIADTNDHNEIEAREAIQIPEKKELSTPAKTNKSILFLSIVVAILVLAGVGYGIFSNYRQEQDKKLEEESINAYCGTELVNAAQIAFMESLSEYYGAIKVASSTSKIALTVPVSRMQDIRSQFSKLDYPPCMSTARLHIIDGMDYSIDGFLAFMSEESESSISSLFEKSNTLLNKGFDEIMEISACAPDCY